MAEKKINVKEVYNGFEGVDGGQRYEATKQYLVNNDAATDENLKELDRVHKDSNQMTIGQEPEDGSDLNK